MKPSVLVTSGEQRSALAITRSLGRAGYRVLVTASRAPSLAGASRYAVREIPSPDPVREPAACAEALRRIVEETRPEVLIPVTEAALLAALPLAAEFPETRVPFPDLERFLAVCDKTRVLSEARTLGIAVPGEIVLEGRADAEAAAPDALPLPAVLKPARSVSIAGGARGRHRVVHASDPEALRRALEELPAEAYPVHVQERIVGPGVGVFLLPWEGRLLARFAHRRLREKPPSGGVSVLRESIPADPALVRRSLRLLERFDWNGVAMVEYKLDARSGEPYLMEINGRFWGSLELAIRAGVDFPRLLVDACLGRPVDPVESYREGVKCRWLWGDVDQLLTRLRHSREALALPEGTPGRGRALLEFVSAFATGRPEVLRLTDPAPFWRESVDWLRAARRASGGATGSPRKSHGGTA